MSEAWIPVRLRREMGQLAAGTGRKNTSLEIYSAQFLDFGIVRDRFGTSLVYLFSRRLSPLLAEAAIGAPTPGGDLDWLQQLMYPA